MPCYLSTQHSCEASLLDPEGDGYIESYYRTIYGCDWNSTSDSQNKQFMAPNQKPNQGSLEALESVYIIAGKVQTVQGDIALSTDVGRGHEGKTKVFITF